MLWVPAAPLHQSATLRPALTRRLAVTVTPLTCGFTRFPVLAPAAAAGGLAAVVSATSLTLLGRPTAAATAATAAACATASALSLASLGCQRLVRALPTVFALLVLLAPASQSTGQVGRRAPPPSVQPFRLSPLGRPPYLPLSFRAVPPTHVPSAPPPQPLAVSLSVVFLLFDPFSVGRPPPNCRNGVTTGDAPAAAHVGARQRRPRWPWWRG